MNEKTKNGSFLFRTSMAKSSAVLPQNEFASGNVDKPADGRSPDRGYLSGIAPYTQKRKHTNKSPIYFAFAGRAKIKGLTQKRSKEGFVC